MTPVLDHPVAGPLAKLAAAYVAIFEVIFQIIFGRIDIPYVEVGLIERGFADIAIPREVFLLGAVVGSLYALIGIGLILVHRANRIINFAQAQLGAVPAVAGLLLVAFKGWSYWAVLPIVLGGAVLLGAGIQKSVIARFSQAPRLILTVVTIGVGFLLLFAEFVLKDVISGNVLATAGAEFPTPWGGASMRLGTAIVTGDHVVTVLVVAACVLGLKAFFRFTDIGIAVRASAENSDRAALCGIPVARISTVVWVIAAVLSSIGVFLRAPVLGLPLTGFTGPSVLLFGLAAAVIARMDSFGRCLVAGVAIGAIERGATFSTGTASLANATMLVVILLALAAQRGALSRAADTGVSTWQAVKELRPIPLELRDVAIVRRASLATKVIAIGLLVGAPAMVGEFRTGTLTQMVTLAMVGVSLVILTGWSGQISLGQWAIAGIGGAVGGGLAANHNLDFFVVLFVAGLAGALAALAVGLPALRVQGMFLAVTTLAFASTVQNFVLRRTYFPWLLPDESRFVELPALYGAFDLGSDSQIGFIRLHAPAKLYLVSLVFLALVMAMAKGLRSTRSGRLFVGARDNTRLLQAFGVGLARTRLAAFSISGFIAGLAGMLFVYQQSSVDADSFRPEDSILVFSMTVIGGISSLSGAVLGAVFIKGVPLLPVLRDIENIELLASGLGLLAILVVLPGGLAEGMHRIRDRFLRMVAEREGIHVPSLVADSLVRDDIDSDLEAAEMDAHHERVSVEHRDAALLAVRDLEVAYDRVQVLFGVDVDVEAGECVALLGTNGAGKSTVLKAACGLQPPMGGSVVFDGVDLTGADPGTIARAGIVLVPGGRAVFPTLTVDEHLRLAAWLYRDDPDWVASATASVFEMFPRLVERHDQMAGNLSGGEQQMLALGMAFIAKPRLLIIDELSLGLAPTIVTQLLEIVREIQAQGTSVLLVEQSINVALTVADRAYFLEKGEVRFSGPTADLLERTDLARSVFLLTAGTDSAGRTAKRGRAKATDADVGALHAAIRRHAKRARKEPVLIVDGLSVAFGGIRAVDDCSFTLARAEVLGIIGANGAGKTTVFDLISGFLTAQSGRITLDSDDIGHLPPDARAWLGLGRSFQDARLIGSLTVAENLALSLERHLEERDHIAAALRLPGIVDLERDVAWTVEDLVELMHLGAYRDKFVRELSTGSRRIVDLAMNLAHEPKVLLLDEPSSGIAQREAEAMAPLFRRIQTETSCSLLIIEHDMPLITAVSDRMLCLELGHPLVEGTPAKVLDDPRVQASYLGGDPVAISRSATGVRT